MSNKTGKTTLEILPFLLKQREGSSLEFKREMYQLDTEGEGKKKRKGELVKDIVSLANGNTSSVGETAYLIIGADNAIDSFGHRELFDVEIADFNESRLLDIVNEYIEPKLVDVSVEPISCAGKKIILITIPPTPHLFETIRELETPSRKYSEYTVFIRENEKSKVASTREREAIRKLKEIYYSETRNPSPIPFGMVIGGLAAIPLGTQLGKQQFNTLEGQIAGGITGVFIGSILGFLAGSIYSDIKDVRAKWHKKSRFWRIAVTLIPIAITIIWWVLIRK